ncbi:MAG: NAD(P)/FAD-dependent oxidoreductase [Candidatus Thorarchaeota archaeon]|nr:MAG: NAD(P)/FAD-dependent oxidoreductase [Candidatus Thorarchaeota archaeon]
MFDVAVIGAGPGGATASRYLAKNGLKVCMIDKDHFPRDKPCGGGFSEGLLDEFPYLRKREEEFLKGVAKVGVLHSPNRKIVLRGTVDMAVTLRTDVDNVLFESAIEEGAEPLVGTRAKSVRFHDEYVEVVVEGTDSIKARVIIGADGVSSMVARETGLNKRWPSSMITACRVAEVPAKYHEIVARYSENLDYHFYANLGGLPGYGWIFPKRDTINIGLGIVGTHAQGLPRVFNAFVHHLKMEDLLMKNADVSGAKGALVPTGGPLSKSYIDRCILLGDSAGMVSPLTGGGIAYAMRAAKHATVVLTKALEKDDLRSTALNEYEQLWRREFGNEFNDQLLAQKIFTSPFTNLLFEIGSRDTKIQHMVSEAMAESSDAGIDMKRLILRTLYVCLRASFGL